ncbi:diguanylate cyclase domain-containing protein [Burkholderia sp. ABCPW 11]|uniref:diguanylate cyclase domain-containing protein n=1 Tax=unclassified Burkholderia TaxID=2613784 RepID=UPI00359C1828
MRDTCSETLADALRDSDVVARRGGDEFVVLLSATDPPTSPSPSNGRRRRSRSAMQPTHAATRSVSASRTLRTIPHAIAPSPTCSHRPIAGWTNTSSAARRPAHDRG